ncbi:Pirin [Labilithrix luteola]|uniref:Pirin n=1 Tax=Labilithrix luteola TaxID=1391654 RepID=A0A0K1PTW7_9BACT|nr:pirin family protein [Labilithrix luteola]AKU96962.1 Pirin [Labilithrix luteola]
MMTIRRACERGHVRKGWLDAHHTFSYGDYQDPKHTGFRTLRAVNEEIVAPAEGFGAHPHRDVEIFSYVLEGMLAHRDSMGAGTTIEAGEVHRTSAGKGIVHSEYNFSGTTSVHYLQFWIEPLDRGRVAGYAQKPFRVEDKRGRLRLVASRDGREGSITIHADTSIYAGMFETGESSELALGEDRHAWIQVVRGKVRVNGESFSAGDGVGLSKETSVRVEGVEERAEVLVFDLA